MRNLEMQWSMASLPLPTENSNKIIENKMATNSSVYFMGQ